MIIGHNSVVVGIDGSAASDAALEWAVEEATRRNLPLHLLSANGSASGTTQLLATRSEQSRRTGLTVTVQATTESPAAALVELSSRADTVVLGSRGHGVLLGTLLGSVSTEVSAHAKCPVVVLGTHVHARRTLRGVVVGADSTVSSERALAYAFAQASARRVPLDVVHAWWTTTPGGLSVSLLRDEQDLQRLGVAESLAGWSEKYPDVKVSTHLPVGPPVLAILEQAKHAELLVVGRRDRGTARSIALGSVSHGVLEHAPCPVAVVRSG